MRHAKDYLKATSEKFAVAGEFVAAEPYGTGHINDTYDVQWRWGGREFNTILQRINHNVFKHPPKLMENIIRVTNHLKQRLAAFRGSDPEREALTVIPTREDEAYLRDPAGNFWRMYVFITDACTYDVCDGAGQAYQAARAFGRFQASLADISGARLHETIPFFHHTPRRFQAFEEAVAADRFNRNASARREIDFCLAHRPLAAAITSLIESGQMPERIAHNDAKINNVMIDNQSGAGICVIDLDTVMSGCVLYDFGDMVRSTACTASEDERDLSRVTMDIRIFEALVRGYLESARTFLTPIEIENLVVAGMLITFTIGIRFLTDHLMNDVYFKIHRPDHNLDRARVQFKMIESMEPQVEAMQNIVQRYANGATLRSSSACCSAK